MGEEGTVIAQGEALVLAGGAGKRMGQVTKAFLPLGQSTFIHTLLGQLDRHFSKVTISVRDKKPFSALGRPLVMDLHSPGSAMAGIYSGLKNGQQDFLFVVACDMPLVQGKLIEFLRSQCDGHLAVVPRDQEGRWLGTCAFYSREILPILEKMLSQGSYRLGHLFSQIKTREVPWEECQKWDPQNLSFLNANTPEEYENLQRLSGST